MQEEFIIIWVLTAFAVIVYVTRVVIRVQSKKLGYKQCKKIRIADS